MNLGIVAPQLAQYGGAEVFLLECVKRWQEKVRVTIYTPEFKTKLLKEYGVDPDRVRVVKLPRLAGRPGRFRFLEEICLEPLKWRKSIGRHDAYLQYMFPTQFLELTPSAWYATEPLRALYDLRYVRPTDGETSVSVHMYPKKDYDSLRWEDLDMVLKAVERQDKTSRFERLIVNSKKSGKYLETVYGRKPDLVSYPGVEIDGDPAPIPENRQALFVGRLWKHKQVDLLVRAMQNVEGGRLKIIGEGPEHVGLAMLAASLGVADRIEFAGHVSYHELKRAYSESTCGAYTPSWEPFGMMPMEAAAAGRASVVTPAGGYGEVLDSESAAFVPPEPQQIGAAIQALFDDPQRAQRMGSEARARAELRTWDRTAGELLEFLGDFAVTRSRKKATPEPLLGAHYYPWYRAGEKPRHWDESSRYSSVSDWPLSGAYTSADSETITRHLAEAERAGLDFLLVNWQVGARGLHDADVQATERLFESVEESNSRVRLAIQVAVGAPAEEEALEAARSVAADFAVRPGYLALPSGRPIWFFLSNFFLALFYHRLEELSRAVNGLLPLASGRIPYNALAPSHLDEFFRGWSSYSPLQDAHPAHWEEAWGDAYNAFASRRRPGDVRTFSICPGYDDRKLDSPERASDARREIPRDGRMTYDLMQAAALDLSPPPEVVLVTSFNEFHENTHIEPSEKYGDEFLKATRAFKKKLTERGGEGR